MYTACQHVHVGPAPALLLVVVDVMVVTTVLAALLTGNTSVYSLYDLNICYALGFLFCFPSFTNIRVCVNMLRLT